MASTHRPTEARRPVLRLAAGLLALSSLASVFALGCGGGGSRPAKPAAPAVWTDPAALAGLDLADLDRLRDAGVGEMFVEALRLEAGSGGPPTLVVASGLGAARRLPATLVVSGEAPLAASGEEAAVAARRLGEELRAAALGAERAGLIPVGFHFALRWSRSEGGVAADAEVLEALRREIDPRLYLSAGLDRHRLADPGARRLAEAVDFLVSFLYGQRPGEPEQPAAWDLEEVARGARTLESFGRDFWVGAISLGGAIVVDAAGEPQATVTATSLGRIAGNPALAPSRALALERGSRQVTVFDVTRATRLGDLRLIAGQRVRVVRPGPHDLVELAERLAGLELAHHRGEVYYRLPQPGEDLALPTAILAGVVRGEVPAPALAVELTSAGGGGSRAAYAVTVTNRGALPTGVALFDHNYVEVAVRGGVIASVDRGGFRRYSLRAGGEEPTSMREVRNADTARLFVTVLDAGEEVSSGAIEVRGAGGGPPTVVAGGRFVLADGRVYELPTVVAP